MAEEGSVLNSPAAPVGTAREVAPDGSPHPIWRAGFAVSVPLPEVEAPRTELAIPLDVPAPPVGELLPPVMAAQDSEEPVESLEAEIEEIAPGEELPPAQTEALEAPALTESVAAEAATEGSDTVEEPAEPPQPEDVPAVVAEMASGPDACDSTAETSAGAEDAGLEAIAAGEAPAAGAPEDTALSADADGPGHAEESAQSPEAAPAPDAAEPVKQPEVSE
jgi:translation initiation factor IF-2